MIAGETRELLRLARGRLPGADELAALRERRLRALVRHAYDNVPYYRSRFDTAGLTPTDIRSVEDLRLVPVSTRNELRAAGSDAFARGVDLAACDSARTSGSTGEPWAILRTRLEDYQRRALDLRSMRRAGVRAGDRIVTVGPAHRPRTQPISRLGLFRIDYVSPLLRIEEQLAEVRRLQPTVLWIYPATLRALLDRAGSVSAIARPRLLVTSAEAVDAPLRGRLAVESGFETRNFYGAVECGRIAWECPSAEGLHVNADCLIVELEAEEAPGAGHPLIVTNLLMRTMPLLRYRLGDRCEMLTQPCSCGASLPLMRPPLGREWDVVVLPSGRLAAPWAISALLQRIPGLRQYRVIQERADCLRILLVCAPPPEPAELRSFREQARRHLGEPIAIDVELVDRIEAIAGKSRVFLSQLGHAERQSD